MSTGKSKRVGCQERGASFPAVSDEQAERAWKKIMKIATDHQLIVQAYGGVATLAVPVEQRKAGVRDTVLKAHMAYEPE